MSRNTFQLIMLMCVLAFSAIIVSVYFTAYGLAGVIEPEVMFERYEWGAYNHNELYCRHKKTIRFEDRDREALPPCFSADITRERLEARKAAREKVRDQYTPMAAIGGIVLIIGMAYYAFLLWRLLGSYRPHKGGVKDRSSPFRGYLWYMFILGWIGCLGCTVGIAYGTYVIIEPNSRVAPSNLERGGSNKEYWSWIGQAYSQRGGMVDMHRRPTDEELTRARLEYLEVEREEQRDLGRLIVALSATGLLTFVLVIVVHWRLIKLLRSWRATTLPEESTDATPSSSAGVCPDPTQ